METLTSSPPVPPATSSAFVEEARGGPSPHQPRAMPVREDCWNEDETFTLIEAWGQHYLDLNRGNLRQKHWQEVADAVNHRHAHPNPHPNGKKASRLRTDVQCKNRIDTLKKKYKVEKSRVLDSHGSYSSPWPFFTPLDSLLAGFLSSSALKKPSPVPSSTTPPPVVAAASHAQLSSGAGGPPMAVPLLPYRRLIGMSQAMPTATPVLPHKRPSPATNSTPQAVDYSSFRKNYSAVAAAAAAADSDDEDEDAEEEKMDGDEGLGPDDVKGMTVMGEAEGIRKLARAIESFGEVYAKVETEKQRQIVELEKQRMQFAKELECQRMQMLVELQVQLQKVKRAKRSTSNDMYI